MGATVGIGRRRDRRGLSLVEVLVALAVVAIALFAIAATQLSAFTANVQAREIAEVRDIATQAVAEARVALIEYAYGNANGLDGLVDLCGAPTATALAGRGADGARPGSADVVAPNCGGGFTVDGQDSIAYQVRWSFGAPGNTDVELSTGGATATVASPQLALVRLLLRVDWSRRGVDRSMSFEDFVGCVDVDQSACPDGPPGP